MQSGGTNYFAMDSPEFVTKLHESGNETSLEI